MSKIQWTVVKKKLKELKLLDTNPRTITDTNKEKLEKNLEGFGNFSPFIIDDENVILAGNQRYQVLLEKYGEEYEVNVSVPDRTLTKLEKQQITILDNRHSGEDDISILADEYAEAMDALGYIDSVDMEEVPEAGVDISTISDTGSIIFKFPKKEYFEVISKLARIKEVNGVDTEEECLMILLDNYPDV